MIRAASIRNTWGAAWMATRSIPVGILRRRESAFARHNRAMKSPAKRERTPANPRSLDSGRSLAFLGVIVAAALCAGAVVGPLVLLRSFRQLEVVGMQQDAIRVYRALSADLGQLARSNSDSAEWESASGFVSDGNAQFIAANFTSDTLRGMHVDLVRIIGKDHRHLFSCTVD